MYYETTTNGIKYTEDIVSSQGAAFILYPDANHTSEDVKNAKDEIRRNRDVVYMRVASEYDRNEAYKAEVFRIPATRPLKWYEIEQDEDVLQRERLKGTTPEEFVNKFVLPYVEQTKAKYLAKYGDRILES